MLRLCLTTVRALKTVARTPRAEFSTKETEKLDPKAQKNKTEAEKDDDFDETEKKQEHKEEEEDHPDEESSSLTIKSLTSE